MANLKGTPESLGVTPLAEGELSRPVRVRAPAWVFKTLSRRSAVEVGRLLETALRGTGEPVAPVELLEPPALAPTALHGPPVVTTRPAARLSSTLLNIVESLEAGAVAEYDYRERQWMVSERGGSYTVYKRHLDRLVKAGEIQEVDGRYRAL
jgi:hypothetical protein